MELKTRASEGTLTAVFAKPQPPVEVSSVQMLWVSLASRLNKVLVLITTFWAVCLAVGKRMCVYTLRRSQKKMNVVTCYQPVKYYGIPMSPHNDRRLGMVRRKVMVLDLDETLIHSQNENSQNPILPPALADFTLKVKIEDSLVKFQVFKRPHVDYFLSVVSQWYDLVIFTASLEVYGSAVVKRLEKGRKLFKGCLFRQHCTVDMYGYTKDLTVIERDLSNIFIIDNSPGAYRSNPDNAIPIKSWFYDPHDTALLNLLPPLDALRFTNDVRSVLSRNLHMHCL